MYARICQLNQQMILGAGPLDVNPTAMLLLQPLFLLLSPVGGTAAVLPRTRTSEVSHSSQSAIPLPRFPISESFLFGASPSSTASLRSVRRGQQTRVIGRGLYVESLMAGTHEVHRRTQGKFHLIKLKKCFLHLTAGTHRLYLRTEGSASLF